MIGTENKWGDWGVVVSNKHAVNTGGCYVRAGGVGWFVGSLVRWLVGCVLVGSLSVGCWVGSAAQFTLPMYLNGCIASCSYFLMTDSLYAL